MKCIAILIAVFVQTTCVKELNAQSCDEDQASFKRISDKLQVIRAGIKKDETDLAFVKSLLSEASDKQAKLQFGLDVEKDPYKAKGIEILLSQNEIRITEFKKRETELKNKLKYLREEEPILVNSFQLIRDRLDEKCGGVKKETPDTDDNSDYSKLSGKWDPFSGGPNFRGLMQLTVIKGSVSGSWDLSPARGTITGGSYDPTAKRLSITYLQDWTKKTGRAWFDFEENTANYVLTGTWRHDDHSGGGSWVMMKKKQ